jgi:hypothetical protein
MGVRQVKFFPTIETDLVGPPFDGEHSAQVTVATAEGKTENPTQRVHRSYDRAWHEETGFEQDVLATLQGILSWNTDLQNDICRLQKISLPKSELIVLREPSCVECTFPLDSVSQLSCSVSLQ